MMSAIALVFEIFPPLKDSTDDSSSRRSRTCSSSEAGSEETVALESTAEEDPASRCDEIADLKGTPFWDSARPRKAELKDSSASGPKVWP